MVSFCFNSPAALVASSNEDVTCPKGTSFNAFCCSCCSDPFFPLSFLVNSWFPGTLDAFFQALFLCALLLFWLCVYHGIRVQVGPRLYVYFTCSPFFSLFSSFFYVVCVFIHPPTGREEMSYILPAKADHCWSPVALSSYTGYMANVSSTSLT